MTVRLSAAVIALAMAAGIAGLYYRQSQRTQEPGGADLDRQWLEHLHSRNPATAEEAARQLEELGPDALPEIRQALTDPAGDPAATKAALKAVGLLGPVAAPAVDDVAARLTDPRFTEEAAVALSFIGRDAYGPLKEGAASDDPVVRRESLRSLGKLRERAPLDARAVVPILVKALGDADAGVRVVAATYLGILSDDAASAVPELIETLEDEEPEVRAAAATALGSFGKEAAAAVPALRKAAADRHEDVAREAGLALVKLQSSSSRR